MKIVFCCLRSGGWRNADNFRGEFWGWAWNFGETRSNFLLTFARPKWINQPKYSEFVGAIPGSKQNKYLQVETISFLFSSLSSLLAPALALLLARSLSLSLFFELSHAFLRPSFNPAIFGDDVILYHDTGSVLGVVLVGARLRGRKRIPEATLSVLRVWPWDYHPHKDNSLSRSKWHIPHSRHRGRRGGCILWRLPQQEVCRPPLFSAHPHSSKLCFGAP